jgi:lactoylglutathione lyase
MKQQITLVTLVVREYDEAIEYFTKKLNFKVVEDTTLTQTKRWVVLALPNSDGTQLLLGRAVGEEQIAHVGNQTGGRVFMFLATDNFSRDYEAMKARGVIFNETPRNESYGTVAVFQDLYGNKWDLLELKIGIKSK